jgi:hypothetical protein
MMSSCPVDQAQELEELMFSLNMQQHKARAEKQTPLQPKGICLNCDSKLDSEARYCDEDCRLDHEKLLQAKKRSGKL